MIGEYVTVRNQAISKLSRLASILPKGVHTVSQISVSMFNTVSTTTSYSSLVHEAESPRPRLTLRLCHQTRD